MKNIIIKYVKNMTKNDFISFINKKNYILTENEENIIYNYIKENINDIIDNPIKHINMIKEKISYNNYLEILNLYNKYKNYIN